MYDEPELQTVFLVCSVLFVSVFVMLSSNEVACLK